MSDLFLILNLLSIIFTVTGLIKPSIFQSVLKDKATRKNIGFAGLLVIIITFILFGVTMSPNVEYKTITDTQFIPYKTIKKQAPNIVEGDYEIVRVGKQGTKKITYKNKYINDKLESSKKIKEEVTKRPISEIKLIGSLPKKVKIKEAEGYYLTALSQIKGGNYELALKNLDKAINTFPGTYNYAISKKEEVNKAIEAEKARQAKLEAEAKARQVALEAQMRATREVNTFKNSCKSIAYKVLERDADSLIGTKVTYRGQVFTVQVSEAKSIVQLNVTNKGYGFWDDQIYLTYPGKINVFKEDVIKIWGIVEGLYTYESVAGYNITVPSVEVKYYSK